MKGPYPWQFHVLLVVIPVTVVAAIVAGYCGYVSYQAKSEVDTRIDGDWPLVADKILGFSAARNAATIRHHLKSGLSYSLFTDQRGARVNAIGKQTGSHADIITIGGSFSWGHGMENEKTFTEILGRMLDVPVANFAYGSYGTLQSLQLLERNSDLKPRVVIYGFITDHIRRNLSPCAPSYAPYCLPVSYVGFSEEGMPEIRAPINQYSPQKGEEYARYVQKNSIGMDDIRWGAKAVASHVKRSVIQGNSDDPLSRQESMKWLMGKMEQTARGVNAKLIVVHIPKLTRGKTNSAPAELVDALSDDTVFIDLSDMVRQHYTDPENPLLRFERDSHPNELAHELIARELHRALITMEVF